MSSQGIPISQRVSAISRKHSGDIVPRLLRALQHSMNMASTRLVFDPDGDLVLRLTYTVYKEKEKEVDMMGTSAGPSSINTPFGLFTNVKLAQLRDGTFEDEDEEEEVTWEVEMLVSAKHLMLASPVFKAMFKHSFLEGETLRATGKVEVSLPDDDTTAMEIILNIIHGRVRRVPREVSMDVMTALSILVDKYQMHEVVELYVEIWMQRLKPTAPKFFSAELYRWLSVAWVFKLPEEFKHLTWIAIRESCGSNSIMQQPPDPNLPIPEVVLAEIEEQRRKSICDTLSIITILKDKLTAPSPGTIWARPEAARVCTSMFSSIDIDNKRYSCEGMILGTLLKGLSDQRLWPPPSNPYRAFSFKSIALAVRSLKITSLCDTIQSSSNYKTTAGFTFGSPVSNMQNQAHGQMKWLHDQVDKIESRITGLDLGIFQSKSVPPQNPTVSTDS